MENINNKKSWKNNIYELLNKKVLILLSLGFSAGLPFLLVFTTLQAWLKDVNIENATIGFISWVAITYTIKFSWAPFLDRFNLPFLNNFFGRRRSWLIFSQFMTGLSIFSLAEISPNSENLLLFSFFAFLIAFFSATQDVALDAYRIEVAPKEDQGILGASYQLGYRIALITSGALALVIADNYSFEIAYKVMAGLMLVGVISTLLAPEPAKIELGEIAKRPKVKGNLIFVLYVEPLKDLLFRHQNAAMIIMLILFYRASDLSMAPMAMPFYKDLGFTLTEIAYVAKTFGVIMSIVGVIIGGILWKKLGGIRTLFFGSIMLASTTLMFFLMSIFGKNMDLFIATIALDNFTSGFAGTLMIAYLSSLTNKAYAGLQYAALFGLLLIPGKFLAGFSGLFQEFFGYSGLFLASAAIGIPAILISFYLYKKNIKV
jgi:PAT family beta-lactamase induction signal transducer AmpG